MESPGGLRHRDLIVTFREILKGPGERDAYSCGNLPNMIFSKPYVGA